MGLLLVLFAPSAVQAQEVVEYYATDAIGSIRVVFNASGQVLGKQDYTPYGKELLPAPQFPAERFGGQPRDGETDLAYFNARMYHGRTGRFTSVDPVYVGLFEPQQWNRYAYAGDNPLRFADPSGEQYQSSSIPACTTFNCDPSPAGWIANAFIGGAGGVFGVLWNSGIGNEGVGGINESTPVLPSGPGSIPGPAPLPTPTPSGKSPDPDPGKPASETPNDCHTNARVMGQLSQSPLPVSVTGFQMMQLAKMDPWKGRSATGFKSGITQDARDNVYRHLWGHAGALFSASPVGGFASNVHILYDIRDVLTGKPDSVQELRGSFTGLAVGGAMLAGRALGSASLATRLIGRVTCS